MNNLPDWNSPQKPAELTYHQLVRSILDGSMPANSVLPNEHQLADALGVTRSTLREALQKLSANGLIDIQHGKPTRVRDIWLEGNMNTLSTIIQTQHASFTARWVPQMLEVRKALAPEYAFLAVQHNPEKTARFLEEMRNNLQENAIAYSQADWNLHHQLSVLSNNPIFTLILNGFKDYYRLLAAKYFMLAEARNYSNQFYLDLQKSAQAKQPETAREIVALVMDKSIELWERAVEKEIQQMNKPLREYDHVE